PARLRLRCQVADLDRRADREVAPIVLPQGGASRVRLTAHLVPIGHDATRVIAARPADLRHRRLRRRRFARAHLPRDGRSPLLHPLYTHPPPAPARPTKPTAPTPPAMPLADSATRRGTAPKSSGGTCGESAVRVPRIVVMAVPSGEPSPCRRRRAAGPRPSAP